MIYTSGRSYTNGIEFRTPNYSVSFETDSKDTHYFLRKNNKRVSQILDYMFGIPLLRGVAIMLYQFKLIALLCLLDFILNITSMESTTLSLPPICIMLCLVIMLYFVAKMMKNLKPFRQYHGAEHKVLVSVQDCQFENCKNAPRTSDNCGTMFAILFICTFIITNCILWFVGVNHWICIRLIVSFLVAYELFLLDRDTPILSWLFKLGYWFQEYLFTSEPSDFQLNQAIKAFKLLEELENEEIEEFRESLEISFSNKVF